MVLAFPPVVHEESDFSGSHLLFSSMTTLQTRKHLPEREHDCVNCSLLANPLMSGRDYCRIAETGVFFLAKVVIFLVWVGFDWISPGGNLSPCQLASGCLSPATGFVGIAEGEAQQGHGEGGRADPPGDTVKPGSLCLLPLNFRCHPGMAGTKAGVSLWQHRVAGN